MSSSGRGIRRGREATGTNVQEEGRGALQARSYAKGVSTAYSTIDVCRCAYMCVCRCLPPDWPFPSVIPGESNRETKARVALADAHVWIDEEPAAQFRARAAGQTQATLGIHGQAEGESHVRSSPASAAVKVRS